MAIKHTFVSAKPDSADPTVASSSEWNDDHTIDSDVDVGGHKLTNLATPTDDADAATKAYVDGANVYNARRFNFRNDWMLGNTVYYALSDGNPLTIGDYTTEWTTGANIAPIHGSQRIGVIAMATGPQVDGKNRLRTAALGAFDSLNYSQISFEAVVALSAQATVGEDYRAEIGLVGNQWAIPNVRGFGHFFRYEQSVGGHKWIAVNRELDVETAVILDGTTQGGVETVDAGTITAMAVPLGGFFRLKVIAYADVDGAGDYAEFYVNGVLCATIATNMVTHSLAGSVEIQKTAGTTSRYLALDYTDLGYVMRTGRSRLP